MPTPSARPARPPRSRRPGGCCPAARALGLTGIQGAGMLGAAERRCAGKVPYQKAFEEGEYWFRMPPRLADQVLALAAEGRRAD